MLEKIALETIEKYNLISNNDHIIVGVSGGADSISLLHFLNKIKEKLSLKITAVHINHRMRGEESNEDNNFVIEFCKNLNISLKCFSYNIYSESKKLSLNVEETGRKYRYDSFQNVLKEENASKIAIAHNKNDNAETIIMRFFRGSGMKGLSGIPFKRNHIIRPFLNCTRNDIEKYCISNNLSYRNDSSNNMDIYTRNKIRLNLIPYLKEKINPNIVDNLVNMSTIFKEENEFLDNIAKEALKNIIISKSIEYTCINIELLKNYDKVIQKRIIRICISKFNKELYNISLKHINMILDLLYKQTGKLINLPNNINIYIEYSNLFICKNTNKLSLSYNYNLIIDEKLYIKEINKFILLSKKNVNYRFFSTKVYTISLDYDKIKNGLYLREKKPGDKILLNGMNKKLKNLFIDLKIPANNRSLYPILLHENEIIGVLGLFISDNYKYIKSNDNVFYLYVWEENSNE